MDFTKKFNIGLTLQTSYSKFERFLEKYHTYIHSFYFSLPLGVKYHTRSRVAAEFMLPGKKRQFWRMLALIKKYGIELELLFNTLRLDEELIAKARACLDERGVEVDSVCFLAPYYQAVCKYFPTQKYIWSFNNGFRTKKEIDDIIDNCRADAFVLGSLFIRNNSLFAHLASRGKGTYLLLNNGCSFNCATCNNTQSLCEHFFVENLKTHSLDYLYALQSIFPCELHDGIIETQHIRCFKISNRSSDLNFVIGAMDSYINSVVRPYVEKSPKCYAYWGRAGYFWKHFKRLDLDKILEYKKELYKKHGVDYEECL